MTNETRTSETCEKCQSAKGSPHVFHYGRSAAAGDAAATEIYHGSAYPAAPLSPWTDRYQVGGIEAVVLCNRCLARARARRAARVLLRDWIRQPLVILGYLALAVALTVWAWRGDWASLIVGSILVVAVTAAVYVATYLILHDEDFAQHLAVDLHHEKLRDDGWDTFSTDNQLPYLSPH